MFLIRESRSNFFAHQLLQPLLIPVIVFFCQRQLYLKILNKLSAFIFFQDILLKKSFLNAFNQTEGTFAKVAVDKVKTWKVVAFFSAFFREKFFKILQKPAFRVRAFFRNKAAKIVNLLVSVAGFGFYIAIMKVLLISG